MNQREYDAYVNPGADSFSHFVDHYDYDLALKPHDEAPKTKVRLMQFVLKAAIELATQKKVKFWMVIQPSSRDLTENLTPNFTHMARFSAYKRTNLTQFLERSRNRYESTTSTSSGCSSGTIRNGCISRTAMTTGTTRGKG